MDVAFASLAPDSAAQVPPYYFNRRSGRKAALSGSPKECHAPEGDDQTSDGITAKRGRFRRLLQTLPGLSSSGCLSHPPQHVWS